MAIFVYAENINGVYKKAAFEAVSYAKAVADKAGDSVTVIAINPTDSSDVLYKYGADKVINVKDEGLKTSVLKLMHKLLAKFWMVTLLFSSHYRCFFSCANACNF